MQTVHVRVKDAATGKPTPCRVRFTDAEGKYYAPFGRLTEFATGPNQDVGGNVLVGMKAFAYINGACEINLPPGPIHVQVFKGPEYTPIDETVNLAAGKLALRLTLQRWSNLRAEGWYPGDTRAHFLAPHAALLEAQAEDLAVMNLLIAETSLIDPFHKEVPALPLLDAFSGQEPVLEVPGHVIAVNSHNTHPDLGSLGLLHCHRVVYPLSFGGPEGKEDWTLADWCDQCHRKNGLVVWTKPVHETADFVFGEPLADLILGKVDAFELDSFEGSPFDALPLWQSLQSLGYRVPLVGGSGKDSNGKLLGVMRTYAHLLWGTKFTYQNWIEALRGGRTFVSNGPLIQMDVNGHGPGATVQLDHSSNEVRIRAQAKSMVPFEKLEIVFMNEVIGEALAAGSPPVASLDRQFRITESGWLAARCRGDALVLDRPGNQQVFAHTSPVHIQYEKEPRRPAPIIREKLLDVLGDMLRWTEEKARCDTPKERQRLAGVFQAASKLLQESG